MSQPRLHLPSEMMNLNSLRQSLKAFASSPRKRFQILKTLSLSNAQLTKSPDRVYVLDSSFNPPTRAHLRICTSALLNDTPTSAPKRLLLLLATQNADKAAKPASFEQRLAMMNIFADELIHTVASTSPETLALGDGEMIVNVGVTKEARFVDKMIALEKHGDYAVEDVDGEGKMRPVEQVHLTGFDTLVRLLDGKYYPPEHTLRPLEGLFERHRVRVTRRVDDAWGGTDAQDEYLNNLREGGRESEGGKREWADRIELVDGRVEGEEIISSTKVREAAKAGDESALKKLVTDGVAAWIVDEKLYQE